MDKEVTDKLDIIFNTQLELQYNLGELYYDGFNQDKIDKTALCIVDELFEFLRDTNYKTWRLEKKIDIQHLKEEWIDIFKFVLNLGIHIGLEADEIYSLFNKKTQLNYIRLNEDKGEKNGTNI